MRRWIELPEPTQKYGIKKFLGNELIKRESFNENWEIIDSAIGSVEDKAVKKAGGTVEGIITFLNTIKHGDYYYIQEVDGDLWFSINAYYDYENEQWMRVDEDKFSFGLQFQGSGNIPGEPVQGLTIWRCVPGENPILDFTLYGGWELVFTLTGFATGVLGGMNFEIDGSGSISGYGRINQLEDGTYFSRNAFCEGSAWQKDNPNYPAAAIRIGNDGTIKYLKAPVGSGVSWTEYIIWTSQNQDQGSGSGLNADMVDGKHANSTPNNILVLDSNGNVPLENLPLGHGGGLDADSVDGRHISDILGYVYEGQGVCRSGEQVAVSFSDYKVALIPFIDKFPQEYPYFSAPAKIYWNGGVEDQYKNTIVAVQGVNSSGKKGAYNSIVISGRYPRSDTPISVSWDAVVGASSYNVYVSDGLQWRLYTNTTYLGVDITGYTGSLVNPSFDIADQSLRLEIVKNSNGFIPYLENYSLTGSYRQNINVNKSIGETYQFTTAYETNSVFVRMRMGWTLNWSGFSGACTWGVRYKIRWKKDGASSWLGERTFEYSESWGSQWFGGSKSYLLDTNLNLYNLEQDIYIFEIYDLTQWANNSNFGFNPSLKVYIDYADLTVATKINEYHGIYLIYVKW